MNGGRAGENIQEVNWVITPGDWITRESPLSVLREYMEFRAKYERAGHLRPLPSDHWIWERLKELPPENENPEPLPQ